MKKVTCIIPAVNEEKTIAGVIKVCLKTPEIGEIITVNDGSKDKTLVEMNKFKEKIRIITSSKNLGKGHAITQGVKAAKNDTLLFLDADMINLKPHHLSSLIQPVVNGYVDITVGPNMNAKGPLWRKTTTAIAFCGQRCLKKKFILPYLNEIENSKYGLEIILNEIFSKKRVAVVPLLSHKKLHLNKPDKQKDWLVWYAQEVRDVAQSFLKNKSKAYRARFEIWLTKNLSEYLKINTKKLKEYLQEEI